MYTTNQIEKALNGKETSPVLDSFWDQNKMRFVGRRFRDIKNLNKTNLKEAQICRAIRDLKELNLIRKKYKFYYVNKRFVPFLNKIILRFRDKVLLDEYEPNDIFEYKKLSIYGFPSSKIQIGYLEEIYNKINEDMIRLESLKKEIKTKELEQAYKNNLKIFKSERLRVYFKKCSKEIINLFSYREIPKELVDRYLFDYYKTQKEIESFKLKDFAKAIERLKLGEFKNRIPKEFDYIQKRNNRDKKKIKEFLYILSDVANRFNSKSIIIIGKSRERFSDKFNTWRKFVKFSKNKS